MRPGARCLAGLGLVGGIEEVLLSLAMNGLAIVMAAWKWIACHRTHPVLVLGRFHVVVCEACRTDRLQSTRASERARCFDVGDRERGGERERDRVRG